MSSHIIEPDHVLQHTHCLVEWAKAIVGGVSELMNQLIHVKLYQLCAVLPVLLQEIILK